MKKIRSFFIYAFAVIVFVSFNVVAARAEKPCMKGAPEWMSSESNEETIRVIGTSVIDKMGISLARTMAVANGREKIALIVHDKVKDMFLVIFAGNKDVDQAALDNLVSKISKNVNDELLSHTKVKNFWVSTCHEIFVQIIADEKLIDELVKKHTSPGKEQ